MKFKVEVLYHQGEATKREDGIAINYRDGIFVVYDGVVAAGVDGVPLYHGLTGAQVAGRILELRCAAADGTETLLYTLDQANHDVAQFVRSRDLPLDQAQELPGLCLAAIQIAVKGNMEVLHAGDCYAFWKYASGDCDGTRRQNSAVERQRNQMIASLMRKHRGDRRTARLEFLETFRETHRQHVNQPSIPQHFALLNGQPAFIECAARFVLPPTPHVSSFLLCSDGCVPPRDADSPRLPHLMFARYQRGGLNEIIRVARTEQFRRSAYSLSIAPEATALKVDLLD